MSILERMINLMKDVVPDTEFDINTTFNDLCMDSLDEVELCIRIEEEFDINIDDDTFLTFSCIKDYIDHIEKRG